MELLKGMWGFRNAQDRPLAKKIFDLVVHKELAKRYNNKSASPKYNDQAFLAHHVFGLVKNKAVVHDSYLCERFAGSSAWPTKRVANCFVGMQQACNVTANVSNFFVCPKKCRPVDHKDWTFC
jgi:hypothetical protein